MPSGTNSQGNHYNTPGGTNSSSGSSYHCKFAAWIRLKSILFLFQASIFTHVNALVSSLFFLCVFCNTSTDSRCGRFVWRCFVLVHITTTGRRLLARSSFRFELERFVLLHERQWIHLLQFWTRILFVHPSGRKVRSRLKRAVRFSTRPLLISFTSKRVAQKGISYRLKI